MGTENDSKAAPDADSEEANVSPEDVRDLFLDEEAPLGVSTISERLEIDEETTESHLERLVQSGIIEKNVRNPVRGGTVWVLKYPQLRVRTAEEVSRESPLTQQANIRGEPRDEEVGIEDVLDLLAKHEQRVGDLTTARIATKLQITARHARDLADDLVRRGVAERREPDGGGANFYWLGETYSPADVEQLLGDPDDEPSAVDQLNDALSS